jgi:signal peptidase
MKKAFDTKIFDIVSSIVETVVAISLIILIILVGFQRFSTRGNLFGYRIYTVASGSMIPTYNIGDTLLIKEMSSENIKVGDAVTYMGETGGVDGLIITHQVQQVDIDENGKYSFHTKGIANNIEDPIVSQDQVLGKVVHKFFFLTLLGKITTSMPLLFIFVTIPIAIIIALEIVKLVYKKDEEIDEEVEEELKEIEEEQKEIEEENQEEIEEEDLQEEKEEDLQEEKEEDLQEEKEEDSEESEEKEDK